MSLDSLSEKWEILMVALVLGSAHVISPRVARLRRYPAQQAAFSGGLSVGYVFLHLIPSLDAGDRVVGPRIYFVALLGFLLFYGLDVFFAPPKHTHPTKYHAYLWAFFMYDGLLVFTLALGLPPTPTLTLVFSLSLALDVLSTDLELQDIYGVRFVKSGRWVLLGGVAFGYALSLFRRPDPVAIDILTAALVGFMMFHTFNGQFPVSRNKTFPAFLLGVLTLGMLHTILGATD